MSIFIFPTSGSWGLSYTFYFTIWSILHRLSNWGFAVLNHVLLDHSGEKHESRISYVRWNTEAKVPTFVRHLCRLGYNLTSVGTLQIPDWLVSCFWNDLLIPLLFEPWHEHSKWMFPGVRLLSWVNNDKTKTQKLNPDLYIKIWLWTYITFSLTYNVQAAKVFSGFVLALLVSKEGSETLDL